VARLYWCSTGGVAEIEHNPIKNWYLLNKHRIKTSYLVRLVALSFSLRCITPLALILTMDYPSAGMGTDNCDLFVSDIVSNLLLLTFAVSGTNEAGCF